MEKSLYNLVMSVSRWIYFLLVIAIGLGIGLYFGWVVSPINYIDTNPSTLRSDFKTDFTLMVAETYGRDGDIEKAAKSLTSLGNQPPAQIVSAALVFAQQNNFYGEDINLLTRLNTALKTWKQPGGAQP